jgi:regulator of RNase E activity RraA
VRLRSKSGTFAKLAAMRQASPLVHGSDDEMERKVLEETQFKFLRSIDTPTVCNLIEIVAPERRGAGYTASHLHCPFPELPPMVGFAKTVTIRSRDPVSSPSYMQKRMDYLDYVAAAPRPSVVVIEDQDDPPGYGAFWGEVQTNVHKALGCLGTVTNGSIRDIAAVAGGFQMLAGSIAPSHAYVHIIEFDLPVTVHSLAVKSGDLIHADRHGAVVVPAEKIDAMHAALDGLMKQEARIISAARAPGATVETIKAAFRG